MKLLDELYKVVKKTIYVTENNYGNSFHIYCPKKIFKDNEE